MTQDYEKRSGSSDTSRSTTYSIEVLARSRWGIPTHRSNPSWIPGGRSRSGPRRCRHGRGWRRPWDAGHRCRTSGARRRTSATTSSLPAPLTALHSASRARWNGSLLIRPFIYSPASEKESRWVIQWSTTIKNTTVLNRLIATWRYVIGNSLGVWFDAQQFFGAHDADLLRNYSSPAPKWKIYIYIYHVLNPINNETVSISNITDI